MLKGVIAFLISLAAAGLAGFLIAYLAMSGWLHPWEPVTSPPEKAASILAVNYPKVWVSAQSGTIYSGEIREDCPSACWTLVNAVPPQLARQPGVLERLPYPCIGPSLFLGAVQTLGECQRATWFDYSTVFALRYDGRLFIWRKSSGGEWALLEFLFLTCGSAAVAFLFIALLRKIVGRRAKQEQQTSSEAQMKAELNRS